MRATWVAASGLWIAGGLAAAAPRPLSQVARIITTPTSTSSAQLNRDLVKARAF